RLFQRCHEHRDPGDAADLPGQGDGLRRPHQGSRAGQQQDPAGRQGRLSMAAARLSAMARRENRLGWLLVSPWLVGFVAFVAGPILASMALSLTSWDILRSPRFIGLANYVELLAGQSEFWQALKVTTVYAFVSVP